MEYIKQKYPYVDEKTLSELVDLNDKKIHRELEILNEERSKRLDAEHYRDEMISRCLHLENQLQTALKELEKIKNLKNSNSKDERD